MEVLKMEDLRGRYGGLGQTLPKRSA